MEQREYYWERCQSQSSASMKKTWKTWSQFKLLSNLDFVGDTLCKHTLLLLNKLYTGGYLQHYPEKKRKENRSQQQVSSYGKLKALSLF